MSAINDKNEVIAHDSTWFEYFKMRYALGDKYVMALKDDLIDTFGYYLPSLNGVTCNLDTKDLHKMIRVALKWIHCSMIDSIQAECCSLKCINSYIQSRILQIGVFEKSIEVMSCTYAMVCTFSKNDADAWCADRIAMLFNENECHDVKFNCIVSKVEKSLKAMNDIVSRMTNYNDISCIGCIDEHLEHNSAAFNIVDVLNGEYAKNACSCKHALFTNGNMSVFVLLG